MYLAHLVAVVGWALAAVAGSGSANGRAPGLRRYGHLLAFDFAFASCIALEFFLGSLGTASALPKTAAIYVAIWAGVLAPAAVLFASISFALSTWLESRAAAFLGCLCVTWVSPPAFINATDATSTWSLDPSGAGALLRGREGRLPDLLLQVVMRPSFFVQRLLWVSFALLLAALAARTGVLSVRARERLVSGATGLWGVAVGGGLAALATWEPLHTIYLAIVPPSFERLIRATMAPEGFFIVRSLLLAVFVVGTFREPNQTNLPAKFWVLAGRAMRLMFATLALWFLILGTIAAVTCNERFPVVLGGWAFLAELLRWSGLLGLGLLVATYCRGIRTASLVFLLTAVLFVVQLSDTAIDNPFVQPFVQPASVLFSSAQLFNLPCLGYGALAGLACACVGAICSGLQEGLPTTASLVGLVCAMAGATFVGRYVREHPEDPDASSYRAAAARAPDEGVRATALAASVDLRPEVREADLSGVYTVKNESTATVHDVLVSVRPNEKVGLLTLNDGVAVDQDYTLGIFRFRLDLEPEETAQLRFQLSYAPDRWENAGFQPEGIVLESTQWPTLGFDRRRGTSLTSGWSLAIGRHPPMETLDLTVKVPSGQVAAAPGDLVLISQGANGTVQRFHAERATLAPRITEAAFALGFEGAQPNIFYSRRLKTDLVGGDILRNARSSIETLVGPCEADSIPVVAVPRGSDEEVLGHSWGGAIFIPDEELVPARFDGNLQRTLFRAVLVHEMTHACRPIAWTVGEAVAYLAELRDAGSEAPTAVPLLSRSFQETVLQAQALDQATARSLLRESGLFSEQLRLALALATLDDYLGPEVVTKVVKSLRNEDNVGRLDELITLAAPEHLQGLVSELLGQPYIYDDDALDAQSQREGDHYAVSFRVRSAIRNMATGQEVHESPRSMPVAVLGDRGQVLWSEKVDVSETGTLVHAVVDAKPYTAGIDPRYEFLDANLDDNFVAVSER